MEIIRTSNQLASAVAVEIYNRFDPLLNKARADKPSNDWGKYIYDVVFEDVQHIIAQLPEGWVQLVNSFRVGSIAGEVHGFEFRLPGKFPWPADCLSTPYAYVTGKNIRSIELKKHPVWSEFRSEMTKYRSRITALLNMRDEFGFMVEQLILAHKTLTQALGTWPLLWEFLPNAVKAKYGGVPPRGRKVQVNIDIDFNKLISISTYLKVAN